MTARLTAPENDRRRDTSNSSAGFDPTIGNRRRPPHTPSPATKKGRGKKEKSGQKLKKIKVGGKSGIAGKADKLKESIRRHYHNAFTDVSKQDAINIFLGMFRPYTAPDSPVWNKKKSALQSRNRTFDNTLPWQFHPHLWELAPIKGTLHADFYLHNKSVTRALTAQTRYSYDPKDWWTAPLKLYRSMFLEVDGERARLLQDRTQSDDESRNPHLLALTDDDIANQTASENVIGSLSHRIPIGVKSPLSQLECRHTPGV